MSRAPPLKRLSERHHALARCLASGMEAGEAAITCGYVASRVSILQADPAFQKLSAFYRQSVETKYLDMHGVLAGLSLDAAMELRERLEIDIEDRGQKDQRHAAHGANQARRRPYRLRPTGVTG